MMIGINLVYMLTGIDVTNTRVVANYDVSMYLISNDIAIVKSAFNYIGNVVLNSIEYVVSNMVSIFEYPIKCYMELHYPVNLFNEDYDISTLKMMFTRNRTLGEYTFQIGDPNLTIYDWVYIDV